MGINPAYIMFSTATLPDPEQIRRIADDVIKRPEFQTDDSVDHGSTFTMWLLGLAMRLLAPVFRFFSGLWDISPTMAIVVAVILVAILAILVWHTFYSIRQAIQGRSRTPFTSSQRRAIVDPHVLEQQAAEAAARQDYIQGVRLLFRAALVRLESAYRRGVRPGTTNRELLLQYRDTPAVSLLQLFVETIDAKWYGHSVCERSDYVRCCQAHAQLYGLGGGMPNAHGA